MKLIQALNDRTADVHEILDLAIEATAVPKRTESTFFAPQVSKTHLNSFVRPITVQVDMLLSFHFLFIIAPWAILARKLNIHFEHQYRTQGNLRKWLLHNE